MSRVLGISVTSTEDGPYSIYLDDENNIATTQSGDLAENLSLDQLSNGNVVKIVVPNNTLRIIIKNCDGDCGSLQEILLTPITTSAPTTSAPTTSAPTTSAPTTSTPTTSAPTTSAPTTSAPTTSAPTTSAPTTTTPTPPQIPTVNKQDCSPTTTPTITGTVGTLPLNINEVFTVTVGTTTYKVGTTANDVKVDGINWTLVPKPLLDGSSTNVTAKRGTKTSTVEKITICVPLPVPTVNKQECSPSLDVVITGTVGNTPLKSTDKFEVSVGTTIYIPGAKLVITDVNWKLTITVTEGTYDIIAKRNSIVSNTQTLTTCLPPNNPTVDDMQCTTTLDVVITGTVGTTALVTADKFEVAIGTIKLLRGDPKLKIVGLKWTATVKLPADTTGSIDIKCTKNYHLLTTNPSQVKYSDDKKLLLCLPNNTPTIDPHDCYQTLTPTITGTIGETALATTETFAVEVNGVKYTTKSGLIITGLKWSLTTKALANLQTYPVTVTRGTKVTVQNISTCVVMLPTACNKITDAETVKAGAVTTNVVPMGLWKGICTVDYRTFGKPDKIEVFIDGTLVTATRDPQTKLPIAESIGGTDPKAPWKEFGRLFFNYPGNNAKVEIKVTGGGSGTTQWQYKLNCWDPGTEPGPVSCGSETDSGNGANEVTAFYYNFWTWKGKVNITYAFGDKPDKIEVFLDGVLSKFSTDASNQPAFVKTPYVTGKYTGCPTLTIDYPGNDTTLEVRISSGNKANTGWKYKIDCTK
jgi:hypothetical protein